MRDSVRAVMAVALTGARTIPCTHAIAVTGTAAGAIAGTTACACAVTGTTACAHASAVAGTTACAIAVACTIAGAVTCPCAVAGMVVAFAVQPLRCVRVKRSDPITDFAHSQSLHILGGDARVERL